MPYMFKCKCSVMSEGWLQGEPDITKAPKHCAVSPGFEPVENVLFGRSLPLLKVSADLRPTVKACAWQRGPHPSSRKTQGVSVWH